MNQDQLKDKLDGYTEYKDYIVIFSGKSSKKVDGLYQIGKKEIIIHNKNHETDKKLMYTALHELAHHIDFTENPDDKSTRNAHGGHFPKIFNDLIKQAIEKGDYENLDNEWVTAAVQENRMYGKQLHNLGRSLISLLDSCQKNNYSFEDVVERILHMKKGSAKDIMSIYVMDIAGEGDIGGDFAKKLAKIKDPVAREEAKKSGELPENKGSDKEFDETARLEHEKRRLEKNIEKLHEKLEEINLQLEGKE
jgi:hypothetical protein